MKKRAIISLVLLTVAASFSAQAYDAKKAKLDLKTAYENALKSPSCKSNSKTFSPMEFKDQTGETTSYEFTRKNDLVSFSVDYPKGNDFTFYFQFNSGKFATQISDNNNAPGLIWIDCLYSKKNAQQCASSVKATIETVDGIEKNGEMSDDDKKLVSENISCPKFLINVFKEGLNNAINQPESKFKSSPERPKKRLPVNQANRV